MKDDRPGDVVWVLVCHSDCDREPGIVMSMNGDVISEVMVRNCCLMCVPEEAEVLGHPTVPELARLLGIDVG